MLVTPQVQVIPWVLSEAEKLYLPVSLDNYPYTVYVGALHGMMTAQFLGDVMSDIFGEVVYAGIDTDKYNKYPIGNHKLILINILTLLTVTLRGLVYNILRLLI